MRGGGEGGGTITGPVISFKQAKPQHEITASVLLRLKFFSTIPNQSANILKHGFYLFFFMVKNNENGTKQHRSMAVTPEIVIKEFG